MSALRSSADHTAVLRAGLARVARSLLDAWRDDDARDFDQQILRPLDRETDRLARVVLAADARIDTALVALRRALDA